LFSEAYLKFLVIALEKSQKLAMANAIYNLHKTLAPVLRNKIVFLFIKTHLKLFKELNFV
jgi:hypothetical protein